MTADGRKVVSASSDTTLKVWNVERKALVRTLEGHTAGVNSVALTLDGQHAVSTAYDGTLRMWNVGRVQIPPLWKAMRLALLLSPHYPTVRLPFLLPTTYAENLEYCFRWVVAHLSCAAECIKRYGRVAG